MEDMVVELLGDKDNWWDGTVRQAPEKWTAKEWRKVYGFAREGEGMASQTDRFIDGMFSGRVNPKDGYAVVNCKDLRAKRVLEFLVPLLYPEKPTRVTITVGNMIFGALSGERPVDWGIVVKDLVQRLLFGMGKSKATPICPYMYWKCTNERRKYNKASTNTQACKMQVNEERCTPHSQAFLYTSWEACPGTNNMG